MGHCIQAIVTSHNIADAVCARFPTLPRLDCPQWMTLLPISYQFIDSVVEPRPETAQSLEFKLLTGGFRSLLREISRSGKLAYVETDYFGGIGGQGAVVFAGGTEILPPTWARRGVINRALGMLGVRRGLLADRFTKIGLHRYRDNDDIVEAALAQSHRV